jgi:hypothetical protein
MQIREVFQQTYLAENTEQFEGLLNSWYYWATHSQLAPIMTDFKLSFARLSSFLTTFCFAVRFASFFKKT